MKVVFTCFSPYFGKYQVICHIKYKKKLGDKFYALVEFIDGAEFMPLADVDYFAVQNINWNKIPTMKG